MNRKNRERIEIFKNKRREKEKSREKKGNIRERNEIVLSVSVHNPL